MTTAAPVIRRSEIPNIHGQRLFNPFPGLRPFGPSEADLFFGREQHIEELLQRLASSRFVAVVGTSGSGKSSLVMAGVLPRLDGGFRTPFGSFWRVARMRPGDDPIGNLAAALAPDKVVPGESEDDDDTKSAGDDTGTIRLALAEAGLQRSRLGLVRAAREIGLEKRENLLVVVDQFEEIFRFQELRQRANRDTATAFVNLLLTATRQTEMPVYVLITMRSDFLGECVQFRGLPEVINKGQYLIPLLNRRQRQAAIEGPVGVAGASVSGPLLQRLLSDAGKMTDTLPVLQHALMRTFDIWMESMNTDKAIDLVEYEEAGGTESALARHADEACRELDDEELRVAKVLFRSLADRSRDGRWVRRPCRLSEILAVAETDMTTLERVIDTFTANARSFLVLQPGSGDLTPETVVDLSHESLMRLWKKLQTWGEEEVRAAEQLQLLSDAANRYDQDRGGLWSDPELALALKWQEEKQPNQIWANRYGIDYEKVKCFIRKSREVRDMRAAELERDRTTRLEQAEALAAAEQEKAEEARLNVIKARQHTLQLRKWIVLAIMLAVAALAVAGYAMKAQNDAVKAKQEAETERNAANRAREKEFDLKQDAESERKRADEQKKKAYAEMRKAEKASEMAFAEKEKAEKARLLAIESQKKAEAARIRAEKNRRKAVEERLAAEEARKSEARVQKELLEREAAEVETLRLKQERLKNKTDIPEWK
ncbi:MAG: hypothetical protein JXR76_00530 [Deltaproteobacteria bacterium]|nr:hypothetical protein [Deltaproteobacteria bacterium]